MTELIQANEVKMLLEEKRLFYLWNILCKPHGNHNSEIQSSATKHKKRENKEKHLRSNHQTKIAVWNTREKAKIQVDSNQETKDVNTVIVSSCVSMITLHVNGLNSAIKRDRIDRRIKKQDPIIHYLQETLLSYKDKHRLKVNGVEDNTPNT